LTYHSPTSLASALDIAGLAGSRVVAGGTDLYPSAKQGIRPKHFLDVSRVGGLGNIGITDAEIRIGATASWTQIIQADLPPAFDGLKQAAREVGSVQIQNAATLAGNLCNASPAADGVPPLLSLSADVELSSAARGVRRLPLADFIKGVRKTALADDELMTAVIVPTPAAGARSAFEKLGSRHYLVISITMTAAVVECDTEGRITSASVAVGACSPVAQRLPAVEKAAIGMVPADIKISPDLMAQLTPISDVRGSDEYRLDVVAEQCARAIRKAAAR